MTLTSGDIIKDAETNKVGIVIRETTLSFKKNKVIYECLVGGRNHFYWKNQIKKLS
jgi:hypothetical protein